LPEDIKQYGVIDLAEIERLAEEDPANYQVIRGWEFTDENGNPISQRMVILINAHTGHHPKNVEDPAKVLVEMIEMALERRKEKYGNTRIPLAKGTRFFEIKPDTPFVFVYMEPNRHWDNGKRHTYIGPSVYMASTDVVRFGFWQNYVIDNYGTKQAFLIPVTGAGSAAVQSILPTIPMSDFYLTKLQTFDYNNLPSIPIDWRDRDFYKQVQDSLLLPKLCDTEYDKVSSFQEISGCYDSLFVAPKDPYNSLAKGK